MKYDPHFTEAICNHRSHANHIWRQCHISHKMATSKYQIRLQVLQASSMLLWKYVQRREMMSCDCMTGSPAWEMDPWVFKGYQMPKHCTVVYISWRIILQLWKITMAAIIGSFEVNSKNTPLSVLPGICTCKHSALLDNTALQTGKSWARFNLFALRPSVVLHLAPPSTEWNDRAAFFKRW